MFKIFQFLIITSLILDTESSCLYKSSMKEKKRGKNFRTVFWKHLLMEYSLIGPI